MAKEQPTPAESPTAPELQWHLAAIVNSSPDAIITKTLDGIITSWNPGAERMFGYTAEEAIGKTAQTLFPAERAEEEGEVLERIRQHHRVEQFDTVRVCKDGSRVRILSTMAPIAAAGGKIIGVSKIARKITDIEAQAGEIERLNRLYATLSQINQAIVRTRSREELFAEICRVFVQYGRFKVARIGWLNTQTREVSIVAQHGGAGSGDPLKAARFFADDLLEARSPACTSIREGHTYVCQDLAIDPVMESWREAAVRRGLAACASVPFRFGGAVRGALIVYAGEKNVFGKTEVTLLEEAAMDVSFALDHFEAERQSRQAGAVLASERDLLQVLMDNLPDTIYFKDIHSRFTRVNRAQARNLGLPNPEAALGKSDADFFPAHLARRKLADEQKVLSTGRPMLDLVEESGTTGGRRWVSSTKAPILGPEGQITGLVGISRDITERKLAEENLAAEHYLLNSLLANTPDRIYFKDRESRFIKVNKAMARMNELPGAQKLLGKTDFDIFDEPQARHFYEAEQRLMATGEPMLDVEEREVWPDGHVRWISNTKLPLFDSGGKITGLVGVSRDITTRKAQEVEIARLNRLYSALSQINQAIVRTSSRADLFAEICRVIIQFGGFKLAWIGWLDAQTREVKLVERHGAPGASDYLKNLRVFVDDRPESRGPTGISIREGRTYVCQDFDSDPATLLFREAAMRHGLAASVSVPIRLAGAVCGALMVYADEKNFFGNAEVALLEEAAVDISYALDRIAAEEQRHRAEQIIRESEERYRQLFELESDAIVLLDATTRRLLEVNQSAQQLYGYSREEFLQLRAEDVSAEPEQTRQTAGSGNYRVPLRWHRKKNGEKFPVEIAANLIQYRGQSAELAAIRDITERRRHEQQITRLNECFAGLGVDPEENLRHLAGLCGEVSEATFAVYQRLQDGLQCAASWQAPPDFPPREPSEGRMAMEVIHQNSSAPVVLRDLAHGPFAQTDPAVGKYSLKTCVAKTVRCQGIPAGALCVVFQDDREPRPQILQLVQIIAAAMGIEEESLQAERRLVDALNFSQTVIRTAPVGIVVYKSTGECISANAAAAEIVGGSKDQLLRQNFRELEFWKRNGLLEAAEAALSSQEKQFLEVHSKSSFGRECWMVCRLAPFQYASGTQLLVTLSDISEQRQLENRLLQSQKMEAVGTLAGGIAHDFNNILTALYGFAFLLKTDTQGNPSAQENIAEILAAIHRAKDLVQQILTFSRRREQNRQVMRLEAVIKEAIKFLRASLPAQIQIDLNLAANAPAIFADPTQMYQVTVNLATNALHAMEDRPGRLSIGLDSFEPDDAFIQTHPDFRRIQYARLTVADTGCGMDAPTLARIFEPFFTTKPVGKGTGLGLAVVHGIVHSHEGAILVESRLGEGTTFSLNFPAHTAGPVATSPDGAAAQGHGQKILLLDDEPALTKALELLLVKLNYQVTACTRPLEAISIVRANPSKFDLVITDLTMPEINGLSVARQVQALRKDLPVILTSGYGATLTPENLQAAGICEFIEKPISVETLATALKRILP